MQAETDYKAECIAGDTIESLGCRVDENSNGTGIIRSGFSEISHQVVCLVLSHPRASSRH